MTVSTDMLTWNKKKKNFKKQKRQARDTTIANFKRFYKAKYQDKYLEMLYR